MTVAELIAYLSTCPADAQVRQRSRYGSFLFETVRMDTSARAVMLGFEDDDEFEEAL